jgi:hypothetical protein
VVAGLERQDLDHHARLAGQFGQLVELLAHYRGAADHVPQHALGQDVSEHRHGWHWGPAGRQARREELFRPFGAEGRVVLTIDPGVSAVLDRSELIRSLRATSAQTSILIRSR